MAKSQGVWAGNLSQLVRGFRCFGDPGGRLTGTLRRRSRRFPAPIAVRKFHATPAQVVASNHTGLKALKKRLEIGDARRDDAEVEHDLRAHRRGPEIKRWILRVGCVIQVDQLNHRRRYNPTTLSVNVQLRTRPSYSIRAAKQPPTTIFLALFACSRHTMAKGRKTRAMSVRILMTPTMFQNTV